MPHCPKVLKRAWCVHSSHQKKTVVAFVWCFLSDYHCIVRVCICIPTVCLSVRLSLSLGRMGQRTTFYLIFWDIVCHWPEAHQLVLVGWCAGPKDPPFSISGNENLHSHIVFTRMMGNEPSSLCLKGKCFADGAILTASLYDFSKQLIFLLA